MTSRTTSETRDGALTRLLILEPEKAVARRLLQALGRACCASTDLPNQDAGRLHVCEYGCRLGSSLRHLHAVNLDDVDVIVCATDLHDGSGFDALAYVRGVRPSLPFILTGAPRDHALARQAIRFGATDFLPETASDLESLPLALDKALTLHHIRHENERLQRELSRSLAELALKQRELRTVIGQLETMARTDELTQLYNRRWLNLTLAGSWAEADRHGFPLAFAMIDLDGFKTVNDELGHHHGDEILRLTGRVIRANSRNVDVAARYGGDEFCILMPHTPMVEAERVMRRVLQAFREELDALKHDETPVGMSVGLAHNLDSRAVNGEHLVQLADEAMYAAKTARVDLMMRAASGVRG